MQDEEEFFNRAKADLLEIQQDRHEKVYKMTKLSDQCFALLEKMRATLLKAGSESSTSIEYQDAIARFIFENSYKGGSIIEVGCYKGGLTAQLAFAAKVTGSHLYTIDIDRQWISHTQELLQKFNLQTHTTFYHGNFAEFADSTPFDKRPLLAVIDGDHRYEAVLEDIRSIYRLTKVPHAVAFHDFSLRYVEPCNNFVANTFVDKAIFDSLGPDVELIRIGFQVDEDPYTHKLSNPHSETGHYWEKHGSEGVIVFMPPPK